MPERIRGGVRAVAPSGVLGDPTGASAEEGAESLAALVAATVRRITHGTADARGRLRETRGTRETQETAVHR